MHSRITRQNAFPIRHWVSLSMLGLLVACSSGGGGGDDDDDMDPPPVLGPNTLSGQVREPSGAGLAGVLVSAGTATAVSNAQGQYVLSSAGSFATSGLIVEFDGTTAGSAGQYPVLDISIDLPAGQGDAVVPQVITLPDLFNPMSSTQTVATGSDGATNDPIDVAGTEPDLGLSGPLGTIITLDGVASATSVDLNMTPVAPEQVPMPLPDGLQGGGFVTVQPGQAAFDPPGAAVGLDVSLPNALDLPVGAEADIWSFDHEDGVWVNRSTETGQTGMVVDLGGGMTAVEAPGVITEGGWHTAVFNVDPDCATTWNLRVLDCATDAPIAGANVALSTGQFGTTGADGRVSIPLVPAYDVAALLGMPSECIGADLSYQVFLPPSFGSLDSAILTTPGSMIVTGGTTDAGDLCFDLLTTGTLAGILNGAGVSTMQAVSIKGGGSVVASTNPNENGSFFLAGLEAGNYTACYTFEGQQEPTEVAFTITANQLTSITIQFMSGGGSDDVTVTVFLESGVGNGVPATILPGAQVILRGSDSGSSNGLIATTDANGQVTFNGVDGPFDVTAQSDQPFQASTFRLCSSIMGISPPNGQIGVLVYDLPSGNGATDATLQGTIANAPILGAGEVLRVQVIGIDAAGTSTSVEADVDGNGDYTVSVPSGVPLDMIVIHGDDSGNSLMPIATLLGPDLGTVESGNTLTQGFDWNSAGRVDWDQAVNVDFDGAEGTTNLATVSVSFFSETDAVFYSYAVYSGVAEPFVANFPDPNDPGLAGQIVQVDSSNFSDQSFTRSQICNQRLTSLGSTYTVSLIPSPSWVIPFSGASYTVSQASSLDLSWMLGSTPQGGEQGVEQVTLGGTLSDGGSGMILYSWRIDARLGTTGFRMPPVALPVFESGSAMTASVFNQRTVGPNFDFDSFYNEDLNVNIDAYINTLTGVCISANTVSAVIQ